MIQDQLPLVLAGVELTALASGALWWPEARLLAVADLHLEKGASFAARGAMLPPYDTQDTLQRLGAEIERWKPAHVVALGDSFHDKGAVDRACATTIDLLSAAVASVGDWIWISGNHDPSPEGPWGGQVAESLAVGPLLFHHQAEADAPIGEVSGHFHPKTRINLGPRSISGGCFLFDGAKLILPAFGAYAGGLDIRDPAITSLFPRGFKAFLTARGRILPVATPTTRRR